MPALGKYHCQVSLILESLVMLLEEQVRARLCARALGAHHSKLDALPQSSCCCLSDVSAPYDNTRRPSLSAVVR